MTATTTQPIQFTSTYRELFRCSDQDITVWKISAAFTKEELLMKMTWKPWPKRASLSKALKGFGGLLGRKFNGAAILVTVGAAIVSLSVAAIYRPAGGILWGLFIILAAIDMRR